MNYSPLCVNQYLIPKTQHCPLIYVQALVVCKHSSILGITSHYIYWFLRTIHRKFASSPAYFGIWRRIMYNFPLRAFRPYELLVENMPKPISLCYSERFAEWVPQIIHTRKNPIYFCWRCCITVLKNRMCSEIYVIN